MRLLVVFAALVGAGLAVFVPAAAADEYLFAASDGTVCRLQMTHSSTKRNGLWDISFDSTLPCSGGGGVGFGQIHASLTAGPPNYYPIWDAPYSQDNTCGGSRGCYWAIHSGAVIDGLPDGEYEHDTSVGVTLAGGSAGLGEPAVWVVLPVGCVPSGATAWCGASETFSAG